MQLDVKTDDLLEWARYMTDEPRRTKISIARALNQLGDGIARQLSLDGAQRTGMTDSQVRQLFRIKKATAARLVWELDAARFFTERKTDKLPRRHWEKGRTQKFFEGALVKILTAGDELVCQACQDFAAEGPYTVGEATAGLPVHPNCRCTIAPFSPMRRLPVTFTTGMGPAPRGPKTLTIKQMAESIGKSLGITLRPS